MNNIHTLRQALHMLRQCRAWPTELRMAPEVLMEIENDSLNVVSIIMIENPDAGPHDLLKKVPQKTIAGIPIIEDHRL